jgi:predicted enzyme related to lactoylglutathione lyase
MRYTFARWGLALTLLTALVACGAPGTTNIRGVTLSQQPLVGKFVWHDLITDDVAAAQRFYGELFGWAFEATTHPRGGDYTLITAGGQLLGGMVQRADPGDADYSRWLPYLSVADVDKAVNYTLASGGAAVVGPVDLGDIGRAAAVTDPQGAVLGLLRIRMGDPEDVAGTAPGQIVWNELLAADDGRAAQFYSTLAVLDSETIARRGGTYTLMRAQGRDRAGIMERPDERVTPLWLTYFAVADVGAAARRAAELGGAVVLGPSPELREGTLALVTDPGGAILALQQQAQ